MVFVIGLAHNANPSNSVGYYAMSTITSSQPASKLKQLPLLRLAFRPFFLLAALFSILSLLVWLGFWHGNILLRPYGGLVFWHQHEMLFGFAAAVIGGFFAYRCTKLDRIAELKRRAAIGTGGVMAIG